MKSPSSGVRVSRRRFLAATGVAIAAPTIIPSSVFGAKGRPAPSDRVTLGIVGWGSMGAGNTRQFLRQEDCQVVAMCDVDKKRLDNGVNTVNKHYDNKDCQAYHDYRDLMARKDIDAVMIALPDHWHGLTSVEAARQKKDIYGEKPLARTIAEQQAIVKAVKKYKRIWQTGSWQRSGARFHKACEIVRNGLIGRITHVEVGLPDGPFRVLDEAQRTPSAPPAELDYDFWIGPAQMMPYIQGRVHRNWRWNYNTGGGQLLDWIGHHCDIAHWGLGFDETGPSEVQGHGEFPPTDAVWNTCTKYHISLKYPKGITMTIAGGHQDIRGGTKWIGTDGWVWVNRGGFDCSNPELKEMKELPDELRKVPLYKSRHHQRNFLDCVKSRKPAITPAETAHRSAVPGHLGLISMITGRTIKWDAKREKIRGDKDARKLLTREFRSPWKLG